MQVDVLAFGAHPDDVEISAGGTVASMIASGKKVAIVDLTAGELGTRGSAELRAQEAAAAGKILGISDRENLGMADGFFTHSEENLIKVINSIRHFRPRIVLANALTDRHPDHGKGAKLVAEACFLSGLRKIESERNGEAQTAHRPEVLYHYIQDFHRKPDVVVDITDFFEIKMKAIAAFGSQFFDPKSTEPRTPISGSEFFDFLKARAMEYGRPSGFSLAEGFETARPIGVTDLGLLR